MIYLDNAATTAIKPQVVKDALGVAINRFAANPGRSGHKMSEDTAEAVYKSRKAVADFFGSTDETKVVFTQNCTTALNMVMQGLLKSGDHIIISSMEHNAVLRPAHALKQKGIELDIAQVIFGDHEATVRSFEKMIKPNTKLIVCIHASNVLGYKLPIEKIGALANSRNIAFCVDAAQTAGVIPINMHGMNIDFLCIAPHKGLYCPAGLGVLIANTEKALEPIIQGGTGTLSADLNQPEDWPERLESGTINTPAIATLKAAIDFINKQTMNKIHTHEMRLIGEAYHALSNISQIDLYTPPPTTADFVPVLSFNIHDKTSEEVSSYLNSKGIAVRAGLQCAPLAHRSIGTIDKGTVRISTSIFNTSREIEKFAHEIKNYVKL